MFRFAFEKLPPLQFGAPGQSQLHHSPAYIPSPVSHDSYFIDLQTVCLVIIDFQHVHQIVSQSNLSFSRPRPSAPKLRPMYSLLILSSLVTPPRIYPRILIYAIFINISFFLFNAPQRSDPFLAWQQFYKTFPVPLLFFLSLSVAASHATSFNRI